MITLRSRAQTISALRLLAAACICLVVIVWFMPGHVAADAASHPQQAIPPPAPSTGAWDIQQEPIVEIEVDVRNEDDVALLRGLGYACHVGTCKLELPDGEELRLIELGLTVRTTARAIKASGVPQGRDAGSASLGELYRYGQNMTKYSIADADILGRFCGDWAESDIPISGAPADATVTNVEYTVEISHERVGDLVVRLENDTHYWVTLWDRNGGSDDGGLDDDAENDHDIYFHLRDTTYFNGDLVNQTWQLWAKDCAWWNTGLIEYWQVFVYYWVCDPPSMPGTASPASGAVEVSRDADLDWADAVRATSYDVYMGTSPTDLPFLGTAYQSQYTLAQMPCGGHYYWQVVAKNACGETAGPVWDFWVTSSPSAPSSPSPANHAGGISLDADLAWAASNRATSYVVCIGTTNPPRLRDCVTTTLNNLALSSLSPNCKYYWYVTAVNAECSRSGPTWDFTTGCTPASPSAPAPSNGATGVPLGTDLDWADTSGATSYDVYLSTTSPARLAGTTTSSDFSLGDLSPGSDYYWRIVANSLCGNTSGPEWRFTTSCLPGTPSGPSPADGSADLPLGTRLDWADVSGATSYDVYLGTSMPPPWCANTTSSDYAPLMLRYSAPYYWQIVAKNECGQTPGPVWTFRTACALPGTPSGPSPADDATDVSPATALDWADAAGAASYDVYLGTTSPPPWHAVAVTSRCALPALTCGTRYYWKIVTWNSCGATTGREWDFTTVCCLPGTPAGIYPANGDTNVPLDATLVWNQVADATTYDVYFGRSESPALLGSTTSSSYALPALAYSTQYYWKIVAKNPCGETAGPVWGFSAERAPTPTPDASSTTPAGPSATATPTPTPTAATPTPTATPTCATPGVPGSPSPANGATGVACDVDLDWADTAGAWLYEVYFGTSPSPSSDGKTEMSNYALRRLSCSTHYYWQVVAFDDCASHASPVWEFTTLPCARIYLPLLLRW